MNLTRNQIIIISITIAIILLAVLMFIFFRQSGGGGGFGDGNKQIELNFWGIEDSKNFQPVIDAYAQSRPEIRINYRQIDANSYEDNLINALAAGRGPDILMLHNTWLPKHSDKIIAATESQIPFSNFLQFFPTVAEQDLTSNGIIYGLPLYIDTLALLYNKDAFDAKAVALPPTQWSGFQNLIPRLRIKNQLNQITHAAAAIGGSEKSENQAADLFSLLMLQFGSPMINQQYSQADFGAQGIEALNFYLQFSNPSGPFYTWNDNLPYSIDAFSQGAADMIFNYAEAIPQIKAKNPFLNIGVAPMLQFNSSQPINYANYWGLAVSNKSQNSAWAWDFVLFATTNPENSLKYLENSLHPPALRTLINQYLTYPDLGIFAKQALTARSWYQPDSKTIKQIFSNMIESVLNGRLSSDKALEQAENEITSLMR
ncbi:MAG: extracellular solute-binding protein [Patescibacteria group bacterium]